MRHKHKFVIAVLMVAAPLIAIAVVIFFHSDRAFIPAGFAALSGEGEVRVVEAGVIGSKDSGTGPLERAYETAWKGETRTVPPGKEWVVVVTPTDQFAHLGDSRERWRGFTLNLMGVFRSGERIYHGVLPAGSYTDLDLYIYNTMQLFAYTSANHAWAKAPVLYLVLELEAH